MPIHQFVHNYKQQANVNSIFIIKPTTPTMTYTTTQPIEDQPIEDVPETTLGDQILDSADELSEPNEDDYKYDDDGYSDEDDGITMSSSE